MSEESLKHCPKCKGEIKRIISAAGIIFKGSGFHVNDYGKKPCLPATAGKPAGGEAKATKETKETRPAESSPKTEKKSESKEVSQ